MITETALQWGGLGLAAIILGLVATYIKDRDKDESARRAKLDQFIQELVERSLATQLENEAAWRKMVEQDIADRAKLTKALDRVCDKLGAAEKQHQVILAALQHNEAGGGE